MTMSRELKVIMNQNGVFEEYDDTYDITIHLESEEEQDKILEWLNKMLKTEGKVYTSPCDLCLYGDRDDKYVHCAGCPAARKELRE
jgi:hypothetical protein